MPEPTPMDPKEAVNLLASWARQDPGPGDPTSLPRLAALETIRLLRAVESAAPPVEPHRTWPCPHCSGGVDCPTCNGIGEVSEAAYRAALANLDLPACVAALRGVAQSPARRIDKAAYIEKVTGWLVDNSEKHYPGLAEVARSGTGLDGVYAGKSMRLHRLVRLAYLRGVRRGASCAWEAQHPVVLRLQDDTALAGKDGADAAE